MNNQTREGRFQVYLALAAISSRDLLVQPEFKNTTLPEGREAMYGQELDLEKPEDFKIFKDRAQLALYRGGFSKSFIERINWGKFRRSGVWQALKLINDEMQLLDEEYTGTDCCISALVEKAVELENELNAKAGIRS